jgi:hypothetical protein
MGIRRWAYVFGGNMGIWEMSDIEYDTQLNKCYISGWDMTGAVYSYE